MHELVHALLIFIYENLRSCIDFLDHLMRQWPSESMETIKRNFYPRGGSEIRLDEMVSVRKGIYSAFRLGEVCRFYLQGFYVY
jgi:hypothetical protein